MERAQFNDAVHRYQDMVYRIALHRYANPDDAEDTVQEVFLRLFAREKGFESGEHLRRWLIRVTVNVCRDTMKSAWRRNVPLDLVGELPALEQPEQRELYQVVMTLPEQDRVVLDLFYYEELTTKEIARLLHIRQTTVTTRLSRARERLKRKLKEAWQDDES